MTRRSRMEIETLLLLDAVGEACPVGRLAARLGLCDSLNPAIEAAARGLAGLVEGDESELRLSLAGKRLLAELLPSAEDWASGVRAKHRMGSAV